MRWNRVVRTATAVLAPLAASAIAAYGPGFHSLTNVALLLNVAVILVAVNSDVRTALFCALVSFLCLNLFFTEPRGSLQVLHADDLVTLTFFWIAAMVVGHLAARLKEKLQQVTERDQLAQIELGFTATLAGAIDAAEVFDALNQAMAQLPSARARLLLVQGQALRPVVNDPGLHGPDWPAAVLAQVLAWHISEPELLEVEDAMVCRLQDGHQVAGVVIVPAGVSRHATEAIEVLCRQASLALNRTRLVKDLQKARIAQEQESLRASLLSSVSHDFRTPLTSMVGATTTLLDMEEELSATQRAELLQSILDEARRLNSYTQNLLDMTRLGQGALGLARTVVSIAEILHVVIKRARRYGVGDVNVVLRVDEGIPSLSVHPALIEQAIYNVLENAIKFSPSQGEVTVHAFVEGARVVIEITDQGPGIPVQERSRVFEMFHAADRGDRRVAGSGLGLAITQGMIGAHGGTVDIEDGTAGVGCTVRITLPAMISEEVTP